MATVLLVHLKRSVAAKTQNRENLTCALAPLSGIVKMSSFPWWERVRRLSHDRSAISSPRMPTHCEGFFISRGLRPLGLPRLRFVPKGHKSLLFHCAAIHEILAT